MIRTADDLLTSIKNGASIPANQIRFSDTMLLGFADEFTRGTIVPELIRLKSEILTVRETVTVTGSQRYLIPARAVGRTLRAVFWDGESLRPLDYLQWRDESGDPLMVGFEGNYFLPYPTPASTSTGKLEIAYYCKPSALVKTSSAGKITSINSGSNLIQVASVPSSIVTGVSVDLIRGQGGNDILLRDAVATVSGTNITLSTALPTDLALNDYVCLAGYSPVVNMPEELASLLSKAVQIVVLEAQSDMEALQLAQASYKKLAENAYSATSPRMQGESDRLNPSPFLNRSAIWRRNLWRQP